METLPVLYQDDFLLAVNKPSALLVHRSEIDRHETRFALQLARNQIGQHVFPVHRLDKPTSGVLLFALNSAIAKTLGEQFKLHTIEKQYLCVTRGFTPEHGHIDHALREELDKYTDAKTRTDKLPQNAQTDYVRLGTATLDATIERYPQSRFSLVVCQPHTGRKHQIRRHMKHINHPIIGDAKHGKGIYNRYFREHLNAGRLLLHAASLGITHPVTSERLTFHAPIDTMFADVCTRFAWQQCLAREWRYDPQRSPEPPIHPLAAEN